MKPSSLSERKLTWILLGLVTVISYFTYFHGYWNPPALFWDENYHLSSAQKYLNGTFFMQSHPPLGKMLIALGEKILNANPLDNEFIGTDYARELPVGFSFVGYRFFPALLAWLTAPLFFGIFWQITRNSWAAFFLSFLYIFDNALIVHDRGAMLESPLVFFTALGIFTFLLAIRPKNSFTQLLIWSGMTGLAFSLCFTTKLVGLILILLLPAIAMFLYPNWKKIGWASLSFLGTAAVAFIAVWHMHFALSVNINPELHTEGYYRASEAYKEILADNKQGSLLSFPVMIRDSFSFSFYDNRGVPNLNLCKEDENGSPFFYWPLGARSISYRWNTPDSTYYQYLYLQANPAIWWISFAAVLLSIALLSGIVFFGIKRWNRNIMLLLVFLALYFGYMLAMSQITRVMYLYHYFVPLLFSFVIVGLLYNEIMNMGTHILKGREKLAGLIGLGGLVVIAFWFYSPLTYYKPLNAQQFERRAIFPLWDLECVHCETRNTMYFPISE